MNLPHPSFDLNLIPANVDFREWKRQEVEWTAIGGAGGHSVDVFPGKMSTVNRRTGLSLTTDTGAVSSNYYTTDFFLSARLLAATTNTVTGIGVGINSTLDFGASLGTNFKALWQVATSNQLYNNRGYSEVSAQHLVRGPITGFPDGIKVGILRSGTSFYFYLCTALGWGNEGICSAFLSEGDDPVWLKVALGYAATQVTEIELWTP